MKLSNDLHTNTDSEINQTEQQIVNLHYEPNIWRQQLRSRNPHQVRHINLTLCKIKNHDVSVITEFEWPKLQQLHLDGNDIGDIGLSKIWERQWSKLNELSIMQNEINGVGFSGLIASPTRQLITLRLNYNPISSKGAKLLSKADLPLLKRFCAGECQLNSAGVKNLAKAKWPMLEECDIHNNNVGCDGLSALATFDTPKIKQMKIDQNVNNLEVVYTIVMNAQNAVKTHRVNLGNQQIKKDVNEILKMKLQIFGW